MSPLPAELLSAALHQKWTSSTLSGNDAIQRLQRLSPGYTDQQYGEARRLAAVLDGAAFELADHWHDSKGREPGPTTDELTCLCPGFLPGDYAEAISLNLVWAAK